MSGGLLTVLGAGVLADFNRDLQSRFDRLRLVDANPLCKRSWRNLTIPVDAVITDITSCLGQWQTLLQEARESWELALEVLSHLGEMAVPGYASPADAILSLNVLSQLEVGWQEIAESVLQNQFGKRFVKEHEQDWLRAIRPSSKALAEQHLKALGLCQARNVLFISDVEYLEYKGPKYSRTEWAPAPVEWNESGWRAIGDAQFEVTAALEGVTLTPETLATFFPDYFMEWTESWLWHISPNGTEKVAYGRVHRVMACSLKRQF